MSDELVSGKEHRDALKTEQRRRQQLAGELQLLTLREEAAAIFEGEAEKE